MTAIILPTTSMPGQRPQESGGRLINCFAESLGETAGTPLKLLRAPGLSRFGTTNETIFRGGFQLGALVYTAWSGKVNTHTSVGGVGTDLAGALPGSDPVFFARNNKTTPGCRYRLARQRCVRRHDQHGVGLSGCGCRRAEFRVLPERLLHLRLRHRRDARRRG